MLLAEALNRKITISTGETIIFQDIDAVWYKVPSDLDEVADLFMIKVPLDTEAKIAFFNKDYQNSTITLAGQDSPKYKVNSKKSYFSPLKIFDRVELLLQEK